MLHAKFQDHGTSGSGIEDLFLKVFTIYGRSGSLGHVTLTIYINFCSPSQGGYTWDLAKIDLAVLEE